MVFTPRNAFARYSFAFCSIQPVILVSAGPPLGGLYLKPPSAGGLCDGVMTMPSDRCSRRPLLYLKMACEMTGVRVLAQEDRPVDAVGRAVLADGLADGQDVRLGKSAVERRAAMPAGAKAD